MGSKKSVQENETQPPMPWQHPDKLKLIAYKLSKETIYPADSMRVCPLFAKKCWFYRVNVLKRSEAIIPTYKILASYFVSYDSEADTLQILG